MPKSDTPQMAVLKREVTHFADEVVGKWHALPGVLAEATLVELIFYYSHKPRITLTQIAKDLGLSDVLKEANEE